MKIDDIYKLRLFVLYHNISHLKSACKYRLQTLLNNLSAESEIVKHVIANIETTTLFG